MKKNILKNRLGIIEVSKLILEDFEKDYNLPKVFFSKFFPINIKDDFQTIHYFGYCEDFREHFKENLDPIPKYNAIFKTTTFGKDINYNIEFREIK